MTDKDLEREAYEYANAQPVELFKALSKFQSECPTIHKGTKGHNYSYADLPTIFDVINPILEKNNLVLTQLLEGTGLRTILVHTESGQSIDTLTDIPDVELKSMNKFQSNGSGITYYRRYSLSSMLGIVTDKDTDAGGVALKRLDNKTFEKYLEGAQKDEGRVEGFLKYLKDYELTEVQKKAVKLLKEVK